MAREVRGSVVVITGASSGIGRATALEFAREGARVVIASRDKGALKDVAAQCEEFGAETLVIQTDVTDEGQVERLARKAVDKFGRIDVWVNNAGVGLYSRFEDTPREAYERLLDVNLRGVIRGSRAAIRQFRTQNRGVLVNVSSQSALGGFPYNSYYATSKFAVRMLGNTLRQELLDTAIDVCTVIPASTDTPFFQHAANFMDRAVQPVGSIDTAESVAREIVEAARNPRNEVMTPRTGYGLGALATAAPNLYNRVIRKKTERDHFQDQPQDETLGNLYKAIDPHEIAGGWREKKQGSSKAGTIFTLAATGGGLVWFLLSRRARNRRDEWARTRMAA